MAEDDAGRAEGVRLAAPAEADACIGIITLAFAADPHCRYLYPSSESYLAHFPTMARAFSGGTFEHGGADLMPGKAAALWVPPGVEADEAEMIALVEQTVPKERQGTIFSMYEKIDAAHPNEPHWYLALIGTDPAQLGKGYGSVLLAHGLARCDEQGLPAFLDATGDRNVALYRRHGFETIGVVQEGDAPPITLMLREPRPKV